MYGNGSQTVSNNVIMLKCESKQGTHERRDIMENNKKNSDDISVYIEDQEYIANNYVLRCFSITMFIYAISFLLNTVGVFVVDQGIMRQGFIPSLLIYIVVYFVCKRIPLSNEKTKYFILLSVIVVVTIMGVSITYHVVLVSLLPFLYATLYSSKKVMRYVYFLTVVSTIIIVYGGYYFGLCDANMALLTSKKLQDYVLNGHFVLTEVGSSPYVQLMLYYVVPRCLIYIAFVSVCNNIVTILSGSLEKAKLTLEQEKAKEAAESANRAKTQFLARMSHEIRTPINAVLGMNEMILRESTESEIKKYALDIKNSANMLLSIINEVLDSSKIESGKMEIVSGEYEIGSLLNDLYNMIKIKAEDKGLELTFDIESIIPAKYYGDDKRIRQVLTNLLTNAVKYTNEGSVTLKVSGMIAGENAILRFSVKDTGIGIKEEDIDKIYDAFQRVDQSRNRYVEGTGLGMNIAQQLLKLMGSELHIKSEYEKGSEFYFILIQQIAGGEPLGDFRERILQASEDGASRIFYAAPKARILVVDDNQINLNVFKGLLKHTQMQISEAESGKECLDLLTRETYDLVFLDHMMPEMDGIEVLHEIQDRKLCEGVPIVMLTANAIIGEREKYLSEGFTDFLTKPIMPDKLDKMILHYLPDELVTVREHIKENAQAFRKAELPNLAEFDFDYAIRCLGTKEVLMDTLEGFTQQLEEMQHTLPELITSISREETRKAYRIEVHTLKSTAASVGALLLSKLSRLLEVAAADNDVDRILVLHPILMEEIEKHRERLETVFPKTESRETVTECDNKEKKKVLLVDDSGVQLRALYGMLKEKYNVQMANSGLKALEQIKKSVPDVILLDYEMPEMDGKETLQKIREMDEAKAVPVVFLSGISDEEHIQKICGLQPAGYLVKPALAEKLYELLETL